MIEINPLLDLIERRFDIFLDDLDVDHLREIQQHYAEKKEFCIHKYGEPEAFLKEEYAKSFLISEAARLLVLREIMPRPKTRKNKKGSSK